MTASDIGVEEKLNKHEHFHYVHLKVRVCEDDIDGQFKGTAVAANTSENKDPTKRIILQIIDVSDRLLFDDIKAEYQFHSMMNAAVSHELRNPLNSMICQL